MSTSSFLPRILTLRYISFALIEYGMYTGHCKEYSFSLRTEFLDITRAPRVVCVQQVISDVGGYLVSNFETVLR